jgi:hypothetical protein
MSPAGCQALVGTSPPAAEETGAMGREIESRQGFKKHVFRVAVKSFFRGQFYNFLPVLSIFGEK